MPAPQLTTSGRPASLRLVEVPSAELALLRHEPGLRDVIDPADLALAERVVVARRLIVGPGPLTASDLPQELAILIDGTVLQEVRLSDRTSAQPLGRGTVLHDLDPDDSGLPCGMTLTSLGVSTIAVLENRFALAARRWPALWQVIHRRLAEQLKTTARWAAVTSLPRVEQRVLAAFWLMADHWGVRRTDGIAIHMSLTHEAIGTMVAARRPTVSLALTGLAEQGLLVSISRTEWLLDPRSGSVLEPAT